MQLLIKLVVLHLDLQDIHISLVKKICLIILCCLLVVVCQNCNLTDYSEKLSGGYTYWNEGEGLNSISSPPGKYNSLFFLKKYDDNGRYISAWQADSAELMDIMANSPTLFKRNTYYLSDKFYIIDVQTHELMGPFTKNQFFAKTEELGYTVEWKPVIVDPK